MAIVVNDDILRVSAQQTNTESGAIDNVYHFQWGGLFTAADADVMLHVGELLELVYGEFVGRLTTKDLFTLITCFNVTQNRPMPAIAWPTLTAGTGGASGTPQGDSVFAFFRTGQPRTIARKFFGVFNGDGMPDGLVSSLIVADVVVGIANLIGPHLSLSDNGTLTYGVVDKTGVFFPVIDSTVSAITAYQRRRRFGRGA